VDETPKSGDPIFKKVTNLVIGNNRLACTAALKELKRSGMNTLFLTSYMEGEARHIGTFFGAIGIELTKTDKPVASPAGIVAGGETTVTVTGSGLGGRNQEIALGAALKIAGAEGIAIASASTDGIDGPTDAAGAIVDGKTILRAEKMGVDPQEALRNNDSYSFFSELGDLIMTGPTGTNVNDVTILVKI
jgi:glycerate-2-kinase